MREPLRLSLLAAAALPVTLAACAQGPRPAPQLPPACAARRDATAKEEPADPRPDVLVVGAVRAPGRYPAPPGLTLTYAIREAGGMTALPGSEEATVTRRTCEGQEIRVAIRVGDIFSGRRCDVVLAPDDVVRVAPCGACIY